MQAVPAGGQPLDAERTVPRRDRIMLVALRLVFGHGIERDARVSWQYHTLSAHATCDHETRIEHDVGDRDHRAGSDRHFAAADAPALALGRRAHAVVLAGTYAREAVHAV